MITYEEFINLREKLNKGEISPENIKEICSANLEDNIRSWHTKDWKERRKQIIKDTCEQCGRKEDLVLKNFSIPKKFSNYYFDSYMHFYNILREENEYNFDSLASKEDIENYINNNPREIFTMCPKCNGNYYSRRREPHLVCNRCKYEFNEPISKQLPEYVDDLYNNSPVQIIGNPANAPGNKKIKFIMLYSEIRHMINKQKFKQIVKDKYQEEIDKKATLDYLEGQIKYLSFENTKTLCKKCAFNRSINEMDLCPVCNKNYKLLQYKTCVDCLPEGEHKNYLKEKYEFIKNMNEMEKELGIN